jgi:hypothetical protein
MNSVIVLVLLGVIWAAVLIPPWLQNRRNSRPAATMHSFHRELWALGRTGPAGRRATPYGAVRFVSDDGRTTYGPVRDDLDLVEDDVDVLVDHLAPRATAERRARLAEGGLGYEPAYVADDLDDDHLVLGVDDDWLPDEPVVAGDGTVVHRADWGDAGLDPASAGARRWAERAPRRRPGAVPARATARRRAAAYQRRRRVLFVLTVAVVATLTWALVLDLTALWAAHVVADTLFLSYLTLLVQRGRRTSERVDKVRYLAPIEAPRPAVVVLHGGAAR